MNRESDQFLILQISAQPVLHGHVFSLLGDETTARHRTAGAGIAAANREFFLMIQHLRLHIFSTILLLSSALGICAADFPGGVKPFIEKHCTQCHDEDSHKAGLRLDNVSFDLTSEAAAKTWARVFDKVSAGEMPPKKKPQIGRAHV